MQWHTACGYFSSNVAVELKIWAAVPVKPLAEAKTRLATVLGPETRQQLVRAMLVHTLGVLAEVRGLAGFAVITPDPAVAAIAASHGASVLHEPAPSTGLNASLQWAVDRLAGLSATGILVLPGDLPLLRVESVEALLASASGASAPAVVIAPDRRRQGTNALLLVPPRLIPFHFGPNSFCRHQDAALAAGIIPVVVETVDLAADVDLPEDLTEAGMAFAGGLSWLR